MKEINHQFQVIPITAPKLQTVLAKTSRETSLWIVASSRTDKKYQRMQNDSVERDYHRVIEKVKQLILNHGGDNVFERDYKIGTASYTGIHSFITSSFSWHLECHLNYNYVVYYHFNNCPYEAEVRQMMKPYPLDRTTQERHYIQGYPTFYKRVLELQDPIHVYDLKAQD